jgi:hypothetical protein
VVRPVVEGRGVFDDIHRHFVVALVRLLGPRPKQFPAYSESLSSTLFDLHERTPTEYLSEGVCVIEPSRKEGSNSRLTLRRCLVRRFDPSMDLGS